MSVLLKVVFFIVDILFFILSILLSFYFGKENLVTETLNEVYLILYSNLGWLFLVMVSNPYQLNKGWTLSKILNSQFAFIFIHLLIVISLTIFFHKVYSLSQLIIIYAIFIPLFFTSKILVAYVRKLVIKEISFRNYILIGRNNLSEELRKHFLINHEEGYRFQGYFEHNPNFPEALLESIRNLNEQKEIHEIYFCTDHIEREELEKLISFGLDSLIKVKLIIASADQTQSISLNQYDQVPGIDITFIPLDEARNQFIKRIFDLFSSFIFLILIFSWLFPLIAILIKIDSKGPIFFIQKRHGERNRPFGCIKFRTMIFERNADFIQAAKNDSRITNVGKFLRKSSIDELPQFLNVLTGSMSLIGPRPHPIKLNEDFAEKIHILMSRHYIKPGITGLAQCMGYRGETRELSDMENRVRLDRYYIENWSFWLDIKIIFLTIISLIRGSDKVY